jgi:long-chain acyl-CoA synthetase
MAVVSIQDATRILITAPSILELEDVVIDGRPMRYWKRFPKTVPDLLKLCRAHGANPYLVYEDERMSYEEAFVRVATLVKYLREECGVKHGDRVALAMRNLPEWALAFWAVMCAGAVIVPLNGWWKAGELAFALEDSGSRVLICDGERAELLAQVLETLPIEHVLVSRGEHAKHVDLAAILANPRETALPNVAISPEDNATIFYTSGTTGRPKGALGTHRNLCANVGNVVFTRARSALRAGKMPFEHYGSPSVLLSVPLFHVTGSHSSLTVGSLGGSKFVLMHKWNAEHALELIERERITQFGGVPAMVWQVLESPDFAQRNTSSVIAVSYGGAPAAPELMRRVKDAFPRVSASNGYGLTETSALAIANVGIDYERKPDSVGVPVPICEVKVVDAAGNELPV